MKRDYDALLERAEYELSSELTYHLACAVRDLVRENEKLRPKRIRSMSKKRAKVLRDAKPIRDAYLEAHPICEFEEERYDCIAKAVDVHEVVSRGRGGSISEAGNLRSLCRFHHDWCHNHPKEATKFGFIRSKEVVG